MADRTATSIDALPITFVKLIDLPALPENQYGAGCPAFFAGDNFSHSRSPDNQTSNMPALWNTAYDTGSAPFPFSGLLTMGVSHADYALREAGSGAAEESSNYFEDMGYIDGLSVGFNYLLTPAHVGAYEPTVDITFQRQVLGDFTGGVASVVPVSSPETQTITFEDYLQLIGIWFVGAAINSTVNDPAALVIFQPQYAADEAAVPSSEDQTRVGGFYIDETNTISLKGLYKGDPNIIAQCRDGTNHYFLCAGGDFVICRESDWLTFNYTIYTPKFSHAALPVSFLDLYTDSAVGYKFTSIYGTDAGFLLSYKKLNGSDYEPKFALISRDWTTVRAITPTAGDATAASILAQGVGTDDENAISIMTDGGYSWLLGGTPAVPLIAESAIDTGGAGGDGGDGLQDESLRLRVWGYILDGHATAVFRVGASMTLTYDLTTGQFAYWASPGRDNWRAHVGQNWIGMSQTTFAQNLGSDVVCGDDASNVLWILDPAYGRDDRSTTGSDPFNRTVTGFVTIDGREVVDCGAVTLSMSKGNPTQTGATITLETSDDMGQTWFDHGSNVIAADAFSAVVEWRALGIGRAPGRVFRFTDNGAATRISAADLR